MEKMLDERYKIDELADAAGGYFAMPSADELAYTELLFDVCDQFGIHYYAADKKARAFGSDTRNMGKAAGRKDRSGAKHPPCIYRVKENMYMPAGSDFLPAGFFRGVLKGISLFNISIEIFALDKTFTANP